MDIAALKDLDVQMANGGKHKLTAFGQAAKEIGSGGAGIVYVHPDVPGSAIKIYRDERRAAEHGDKVRAMLQTPPGAVRTSKGVVQLGWPIAEVGSRGRFLGFVMPLIDTKQAWRLQQVVNAPQRRRHGIPERLDFRLYAARNLAVVLKSLHQAGHHVIDLKPQNVLVYRDAMPDKAAHVILVDCDGFQIRGPNGSRHDAKLATTEFLHPNVAQMHNGVASFNEKKINDNAAMQDNFALAVILFQLLNDGLHPMTGIPASQGVPSDLASRLQECSRYYPYGLGGVNPHLRPHGDSFHTWFDPELRALFDRAFAGQLQPPRHAEWLAVLDRLVHDSQRCSINADHWKLGQSCGLCERGGQIGLPPRQPAPVQPALAQPAPRVAASFTKTVYPSFAAQVQPAPKQKPRKFGWPATGVLVLLLAAAAIVGVQRAGSFTNLLQDARQTFNITASPDALTPAQCRQLQQALAGQGYYHGMVDGVAGPETMRAAGRFARDHALMLSVPPKPGQLRDVLARATKQVARTPAATPMNIAPAAAAADTPIVAPAPLRGAPKVVDTAHLVVDGREITLQGLDGLGGRFANELAGFIRAGGGTVTCTRLQEGYACRTGAGGVDLALAALVNGAAKASADASARQVSAEDEARAAHRGLWR